MAPNPGIPSVHTSPVNTIKTQTDNEPHESDMQSFHLICNELYGTDSQTDDWQTDDCDTGNNDGNSQNTKDDQTSVNCMHENGDTKHTNKGQNTPSQHTESIDSNDTTQWEEFQNNYLAIINAVRESGVPNFMGLRIPLPTKINIQLLDSLLRESPDRYMVDFFKFGWPISRDPLAPDPVPTYENHAVQGN